MALAALSMKTREQVQNTGTHPDNAGDEDRYGMRAGESPEQYAARVASEQQKED